MAVLTLSSLKSTKNSVIGNPQAKLALARDAAFVKSYAVRSGILILLALLRNLSYLGQAL
jgi:hypothetical protein